MRTIEQVRQELAYNGESVVAWAGRHGYKPGQVYDVLRGRTIGKRGAAHNIAVSMGIKAGKPNPSPTGAVTPKPQR